MMANSATNEPLLDAQVRLDSLPATGRHLKVTASEDQRAVIAERLGILSVESLNAELHARPLKGGIEVSGKLSAEVSQACVITFEPVSETISEELFRLFLHGPSDEPVPASGAEVFVDLDGADQPDRFEGPEVDLTEWLVETLSLALEPYPRKPGAAVAPEYHDEGDETDSPFQALKALKSTKE